MVTCRAAAAGPAVCGESCRRDSDCACGEFAKCSGGVCTGPNSAKDDLKLECNVHKKGLMLCRDKKSGVLMVIPFAKPDPSRAPNANRPQFPCTTDDMCHDYAARVDAEESDQFVC